MNQTDLSIEELLDSPTFKKFSTNLEKIFDSAEDINFGSLDPSMLLVDLFVWCYINKCSGLVGTEWKLVLLLLIPAFNINPEWQSQVIGPGTVAYSWVMLLLICVEFSF